MLVVYSYYLYSDKSLIKREKVIYIQPFLEFIINFVRV